MSSYYVATMKLYPKSFSIRGYEITEAEVMIENFTPEIELKLPPMDIKFSAPVYTPFVMATAIVRKRKSESFQYLNQRTKDAVLLKFVKEEVARWNDTRHNAEMGRLC